MTEIRAITFIEAPVEICFDLARDIDLHLKSTARTREIAVAGRTTGLCELGDEITWEATHFFIRQRLKVKITRFDRPHSFTDEMLEGAFKSMRHTHNFRAIDGGTEMEDIFVYSVPYRIFGAMFDQLILKSYMTRFLKARNVVIKKVAEDSTHP
ncbi:MAG: SRPBCC family protein [Planctomycetes bacterium]|nr:SRPBCC family protein [Planctomycetota bacterium]